MGDRAQLEIKDGEHSVFLYTHWDGVRLPDTLKRGLMAGRSIDEDPTYCLGSILREMVRANGGVDQDTGLGVGFQFDEQDDDRGAPLVLDIVEKAVRFKDQTIPLREFLESTKSPADLLGWT